LAKAGNKSLARVGSFVSAGQTSQKRAKPEATSRQAKKGEAGCAEGMKRRRMNSYYVYILQSEIDAKRFYVGFTEDLDSRLKAHNSGNVHHTSKYKPWRIKTAVAFGDRQKALDFEKYLKSPSGRAFAKKRL
jgi:predicted GIY-YIG superfamily endonuclease